MSSTSNEVQVTMAFADDTEKTFNLPDVAESALQYVTPRVKAINGGTATNVADFRATFVSNAGASFVSISAARIVQTTEELIFSGN